VLLSVRRFKIGADTAVPAPDFIDVRAFIAPHIMIGGGLLLKRKMFDKTVDGRLGQFTALTVPFSRSWRKMAAADMRG